MLKLHFCSNSVQFNLLQKSTRKFLFRLRVRVESRKSRVARKNTRASAATLKNGTKLKKYAKNYSFFLAITLVDKWA